MGGWRGGGGCRKKDRKKERKRTERYREERERDMLKCLPNKRGHNKSKDYVVFFFLRKVILFVNLAVN